MEWDGKAQKYLRDHAHEGAEALAQHYSTETGEDITPHAVRNAAYRYRVSLRRPGVRVGLVLTQGKGQRLDPILRRELLKPRAALKLIDRINQDARSDQELCPRCCLRPIRVKITGTCGVCHKRILTEAHKETIRECEEQLELDAARQRKKRILDDVSRLL